MFIDLQLKYKQEIIFRLVNFILQKCLGNKILELHNHILIHPPDELTTQQSKIKFNVDLQSLMDQTVQDVAASKGYFLYT